jgi:hypothetical protein
VVGACRGWTRSEGEAERELCDDKEGPIIGSEARPIFVYIQRELAGCVWTCIYVMTKQCDKATKASVW